MNNNQISDQERFWSYVQHGEPNECWLWQRHRNLAGYGTFKLMNKSWIATRILWTWLYGPIPPGMFVLHKCDNPPCVNPDHLFLGTHRDNYKDMVAKGRSKRARGEKQHLARLNADKVREIRRLRQEQGLSQQAIADLMGVYQTTVGRVLLGQTWKHIA